MRCPVSCVAQEYTDQAVLDATCRAAILALHTGRVLALLEEVRLIHNEYRPTPADLLYDIFTQYVASRFCRSRESVRLTL